MCFNLNRLLVKHFDSIRSPETFLVSSFCYGKVDVFLLKSYARFSLVKVPNQLSPHLEIMTPDKTANQWNNRTS